MEVEAAQKGSSPAISGHSEKEDDYHVMWQASQSCLAFNQLLRTPETDLRSSSSGSNSRGSQRQESFDQIPGFSLLSTQDGDSSPTKTNPLSSGARSSRQPVARARYLDARTPSATGSTSTSTNPLQLPLFDKASSAQFLDILKGVSARVDENAGFTRPSLPVSGQPSKKTPRTSRKRPRPSSLSSSSEVKKGRMEEPRSSHAPNERAHDYKGKSKVTTRVAGSRGKSLREHQSMSSMLEPGNSSFQDEKTLVEENSMDIDAPKERTFLRTPSQDVMPPPLGLPVKQCGFGQQNSSTRSHPLPSPHPPDSHPSRSSASSSAKPANLAPMKKTKLASTLHPLLQQEPPPKTTRSSIVPPPAFLRRAQAQNSVELANLQDPSSKRVVALVPVVAPPEVETKPPIPTQAISTKRVPVLGMRRASTYPNGPSTTNVVPPRKSGSLPTKPKAFKPPLLASQPTRSQQQLAPVDKRESTLGKTKPMSLDHAARHHAERSPPLQPPSSSNGSCSSESFRSSTSSASTNSSTTFDSSPARKIHPQPPASPPKALPPKKMSIPEPTDGDGDSSFGDMSFDMDALEETLRQYD